MSQAMPLMWITNALRVIGEYALLFGTASTAAQKPDSYFVGNFNTSEPATKQIIPQMFHEISPKFHFTLIKLFNFDKIWNVLLGFGMSYFILENVKNEVISERKI